jgi:hypothetical protein
MESPHTSIDEINDGIYRLTTWIPDVSPEGFTFNQFLVVGDEPRHRAHLVVHVLGQRSVGVTNYTHFTVESAGAIFGVAFMYFARQRPNQELQQ